MELGLADLYGEKVGVLVCHSALTFSDCTLQHNFGAVGPASGQLVPEPNLHMKGQVAATGVRGQSSGQGGQSTFARRTGNTSLRTSGD
jgi:hypothetical protein